jgi:hypothetical protein
MKLWLSYKHVQGNLTRLSAQCGVSFGSAHIATRLLKLQPYKTTVVQRLTNPDSGAKIRFCNWLLGSVHDGTVNPELLFLVMMHGCI